MSVVSQSVVEQVLAGDEAALAMVVRGNINTANKRKWTILHHAARFGKNDLVRTLLANGADATLRNDDGKTPHDLAVQWGFPDVAALLTPAHSVPLASVPAFVPSKTHLFAGSMLNRVSNLRKDTQWALEAMALPSTRALVLSGSSVLLTVKGKDAGVAWLGAKGLEAIVARGAMPIVLGVDDATQTAHFAVDVAGNGELQQLALAHMAHTSAPETPTFQPIRPVAFQIAHSPDAALIAQARAVFDWNTRNLFCSMCGAKTESGEGGYKRECSNAECKTHTSVQNVSYPRLDPVVIGLIISPDRSRVLLGQGKQFPDGFYSCLAGFMEPGESIEEAMRREVFEESGIRVGAVRYHSSQPWPFPSQIMIGCVGLALSEDITIDPSELADCKWFTRADVAGALKRGMDMRGSGFKVPADYAIANALMCAWIDETPLARF